MSKNKKGSMFMLFMVTWILVLQAVLRLILSDELDALAFFTTPQMLIGMQIAMFILPLLIWLIITRDSFKANMPNQALGGKNIVLLVIISFVLQPVALLLSGISGLFFPNVVPDFFYHLAPQPLLLTLLAVAVTPAICEELVFRGYIQSQYKDRTIRKAALINGLFFAIIHFNLQQFAYTFVLGVILAYMVHYSRSIWAAIIPHFIFNASQILLSVLIRSVPPTEAAPESTQAAAIMVMLMLNLLLAPLTIYIFYKFFQHNKPRIEESETPYPTKE